MKSKRVIILGAGISGLSLAWFLKRRFQERVSLTLVEKSNRPGGWVSTAKHQGFLFEQGPRGCRPKGTGIATLKLIEQLDLQDQLIVADHCSCDRYLWIDKKMRKVPASFFSCLTSPLMRGVIPALIRDLSALPANAHDESIYSFISRRFSHQIAERLIDPFVAGIYAGNIRHLSIKSCFPLLHQWEQSHGSVLKGAIARARRKKKRPVQSPFIQKIQKQQLFSFKDGMGSLVCALTRRLHPYLLFSSEVLALRHTCRQIQVDLANGTTLEADHLFSTIPSRALAQLFAPLHKELASLLETVLSVSMTVVNLGYHQSVLSKRGFGYLIPSSEKEKILGVTWDSSLFPQQNQTSEETRLTVMIGNARLCSVTDPCTKAVVAIALNGVARHLNVTTAPNACTVKFARYAIPQYHVGHSQKVKMIESLLARAFPKITLSGHSFYGVSLNDCIASSKRIEERAFCNGTSVASNRSPPSRSRK